MVYVTGLSCDQLYHGEYPNLAGLAWLLWESRLQSSYIRPGSNKFLYSTKENEEMGKGGIKLHQRVLQLSSLKEIIFPCSKISFLHLCHVPKIWSNFAVPTTQAFTALQTYDQIQNGVCQKL